MSTTDTKLTSLILNKLTRNQYDTSTKEANQLYICTDTGDMYLGSVQISQGTNTVLGYVNPLLAAKLDSNKMQVVDALPASPTVGVFYFVKG